MHMGIRAVGISATNRV